MYFSSKDFKSTVNYLYRFICWFIPIKFCLEYHLKNKENEDIQALRDFLSKGNIINSIVGWGLLLVTVITSFGGILFSSVSNLSIHFKYSEQSLTELEKKYSEEVWIMIFSGIILIVLGIILKMYFNFLNRKRDAVLYREIINRKNKNEWEDFS
ncbi:hypothetical protein GSH19_05000 [Lactobacillus sp. S2-2]|uniref:hypothetical protein n=1 Tax=Lactobacillus sp. S2-2 TaxID=2692917 RepID=UPI001F45B71D|nr:hypothetical protein [Lactobacillus sp. S2-2]MCF6515509.1 hypothetical protein [Lactobacillus sp. S2-2]